MKKLSLLLVFAMMFGLLAACGGNSNSSSNSNNGSSTNSSSATKNTTDQSSQSSNSSNSTSSGGKLTVHFWHSMGGSNGEAIKRMVALFNETHPNIEVVETYQGGYAETVTKLQQAAASNQSPEVSMIERGYVELFADAEILADIQPVIEGAGLKKEDFIEGLMGDTEHNGTLVSLPFNRSTPIMHVNKTILDELGKDIPTTWDELADVARAAVKKNGSAVERYGLSMPYDTWYPIAMVQQQGGIIFDDEKTTTPFIADGKGATVFKFLKELQKDDALFYPPAADSGNIVNSLFKESKLAILFQSTGSIGGLLKSVDFEYVTAFLPMKDQYSTPTGGANVVMFENAKNKEAAIEFMQWLMTDAAGAQQFIIDTGYLPLTHKMVESAEIKELWSREPIRETAYKQLEYAVDTNKSLAWPSVQPEFLSAIEAMMYDDEDVEATLNNLQKAAEGFLADVK